MPRHFVLLPAIVCVLGFVILPSYGRDCPESIFVGSGLSDVVAIAGDTVYFGDSQSLMIGDASDPGSPEVLSELLLDGVISNIVIADGLAYVLDEQGGKFWIVDVLDPLSPRVVSSHEVASDPLGIAISDGRAYICSSSHLHIIDVTDPSYPQAVAVVALADEPEAIVAHGGWAYVAHGDGGFTVWDVRDPSQPVLGESLSRQANEMVIEGEHLFVIGVSLAVYDISTPPLHAVPGGYLANGGGCAGAVTVMANQTLAWVLDVGLKLIDVTDPDEPVLLAEKSLDSIDCSRGVAASGGLFVITRSGLEVFEWDGEAIEPRSSFGVLGMSESAAAIHVSGSLATVETRLVETSAARPIDSFLIDSTDLSDLRLLTSFGPACATVVTNGHVFVSNFECPFVCSCSDFRILDLADPFAPVEVGVLPWRSASGGKGELLVDGDRFYVYGNDFVNECETFLWDISQPSAPVRMGKLKIHSSIFGDTCCKPLAVNGSTLYATAPFVGGDQFGWGLYVVDVSDPSAPEQIGYLEYEIDDFIMDAATLGEDTLVLCGTSTLYGIDVSDPNRPVITAKLAFSDVRLSAVSVVGNTAYVASSGLSDSNSNGVIVVDFSDRLNPRQIGFHHTPDSVWDLETDGRFLFSATGAAGVAVFDSLFCSRPRPFEPTEDQ